MIKQRVLKRRNWTGRPRQKTQKKWSQSKKNRFDWTLKRKVTSCNVEEGMRGRKVAPPIGATPRLNNSNNNIRILYGVCWAISWVMRWISSNPECSATEKIIILKWKGSNLKGILLNICNFFLCCEKHFVLARPGLGTGSSRTVHSQVHTCTPVHGPPCCSNFLVRKPRVVRVRVCVDTMGWQTPEGKFLFWRHHSHHQKPLGFPL